MKFYYNISYKQSDLTYFGINLLLGCGDFPLRLKSGDGGDGKDISPLSTGTFNFSSSDTFDEVQSSIFDTEGLGLIEREMLYSCSSQSNLYTFRMGSVALKFVVGFKHDGNINDLFDDQFVEISNLSFSVTIAGDVTTQLVAKPSKIKLGKQYGEILVLSFEGFTKP